MGRDGNHRELERTFRQECATTADLSGVGDGVPDIVIGHAGINALVEIKLPPGKRGGIAFSTLNNKQVAWHNRWRGMTPFVARTKDDVLAIIGRLERLGAIMREVEQLPDDALESLTQELRQRFGSTPSASSLSA